MSFQMSHVGDNEGHQESSCLAGKVFPVFVFVRFDWLGGDYCILCVCVRASVCLCGRVPRMFVRISPCVLPATQTPLHGCDGQCFKQQGHL